ncbi:MAG: DMT family transporter [Lachnospiraceae bacterium]|nr:DMT family transporter [Lachnospiraceae bacterium]
MVTLYKNTKDMESEKIIMELDIEKKTKAHMVAFITIVIWGTTYIFTKVLLQSFQPVEILFFRFVIAYFVLMIISPKKMQVEKTHEKYFVFAGLTGITFYYLLENIALVYTQATNVGVIISVAPFFTAIFAYLFIKGEKLSLNFMMGFIVAMVGIIMISYNGSTSFQLNPIGDILALLAALVWAVYSILIRKISSLGYGSIQMTKRSFFYGILFMIPALYVLNYHPDYAKLLEPAILMNVLFLGVGASAICFVIWNYAVKTLGAVTTSIYIYLVPVITTTTSIIVLKEKINFVSIIGILCTLIGLFLSQKRGKCEK